MIVKVFFVLFLNLILGLIQTSFFGELVDNVFVPNLVLAFSFALMFKDLKKLSLMNAFIGGLVLDLLGFNIVGISSLVMVGSLHLAFIVRRNISKGWWVNLPLFGLAALIYDFIVTDINGVSTRNYLIFLIGMVGVAILFYLLIDSVVNYLNRLGIKLEE